MKRLKFLKKGWKIVKYKTTKNIVNPTIPNSDNTSKYKWCGCEEQPLTFKFKLNFWLSFL